jgi:apolipoprotein N-acyltransferase
MSWTTLVLDPTLGAGVYYVWGVAQRAQRGGVCGLAALASSAAIVASAPPLSIYPLAFVCLVPLLLVAARGGAAAAVATAWLSGAFVYGFGLHWLAPTIERMQEIGRLEAIGWLAAFAAVHALGWSAAAAGAGGLLAGGRGSFRRSLLATGAAAGWWVSIEWSVPQTLPWALGSVLGPAPWLRQSADIAGAHGLSFAIVLINTLLALAVLRGRDRAPAAPLLGCALAVVSVLALYGALRVHAVSPASDRAFHIALVQRGPVPEEADLAETNTRAWTAYAGRTREIDPAAADLIVWPESALRVYLRQNPPIRERAAALAIELGTPLLLGALDAAIDGAHELNSAYLLDPHAVAPQVYHKIALVPFAEYLPGGRWWPGADRWRTTGQFVAGAAPRILQAGPARIAPSICFEAILPGWFNSTVRDGAQLLVTLADDGWFGATIAPVQHLEMTRLRAVETRRWLVRASGSGISAVIDPSGEIVAALAYGEAGTLVHTVGLSHGLTPYVRFGNWVVAMGALLAAAGFLVNRGGRA